MRDIYSLRNIKPTRITTVAKAQTIPTKESPQPTKRREHPRETGDQHIQRIKTASAEAKYTEPPPGPFLSTASLSPD